MKKILHKLYGKLKSLIFYMEGSLATMKSKRNTAMSTTVAAPLNNVM